MLGHQQCSKESSQYQTSLSLLTEVHLTSDLFIPSACRNRSNCKTDLDSCRPSKEPKGHLSTSSDHGNSMTDLISESTRVLRSGVRRPSSLHCQSTSLWNIFETCLLEIWLRWCKKWHSQSGMRWDSGYLLKKAQTGISLCWFCNISHPRSAVCLKTKLCL